MIKQNKFKKFAWILIAFTVAIFGLLLQQPLTKDIIIYGLVPLMILAVILSLILTKLLTLSKKSKKKKQKKNNLIKIELILIILTIIFSLFGFILISYNGNIDNMVTGFTSFSIYPDESFTTSPIEETSTQEEKSAQFAIQPIKNITTQEGNDSDFKIQPLEDFGPMAAPTVDTVTLNSTDPTTNNTNQNLTCWNTTSDIDSDGIKSLVSWWYNTSSDGDIRPLMQLYMPFEANESSPGAVKDYSGYGKDGAITGATFSSTAGHDGFGAYEFNGSGDFINLSEHVSELGLATGTLSLWFKTGIAGRISFFGWGDDTTDYGNMGVGGNSAGNYEDESLEFSIVVDNDIKFALRVRHGTDYYNDGKWHHVVVVVGSNYNKIYVDGVIETPSYIYGSASTGNYFLNPSNLDTMGIGRRFYPASPLYFNGTIDEVMIFNKSLSANQIQLLYDNKSWMIHQDETIKGEYYKCQVYPNDGSNDGTPVNSSGLQILNAIPTITSVFISSDDDTKNQTHVNLSAFITGFADIDSDTNVLNETRWYNNSLYISNLDNYSTVYYTNTTKNDSWMVEFRVSDGTDWSIWTNSSNFTILNTPPVISPVYIYSNSPLTNYTNVTLTGTFSYTDIDSDTTSYNETKWYNNSLEVVYLRNQTQVAFANTTREDNWMFSARTFDINNWSIWTNSSNFTVLNAPPEIFLEFPGNNTQSTNRSTVFYYNLTDLDSMVHNCSLWVSERNNINLLLNKTNATSISLGNNNTFYIENLTVGTHRWLVSCDDDKALEGNSTIYNYTIENQIPTVNNVTIFPITSYTNSTLNCSAYVYDSDSDPIDVNISWYKVTTYNRSILLTSQTNSSMVSYELTAELQLKGETWNCSIWINDSLDNSLANSTTITISNLKPQVDLILPANATSSDNKNTTFYYNVSDTDNIVHNCTLWISKNDTLELISNQTNSSVLTLGNNNTFGIDNLSVGYHTWLISCKDDESAESNSTTRYYTILSGTPIINLTLPSDNYESTDYTVAFIYNVSDIDGIANCSLLLGGSIDQIDTTITTDTDQVFNKTFATNNDYTWQINCTDIFTSIASSESRTIIINVGAGGVVAEPPAAGYGSGSGSGSKGGAGSYISEITQTETSTTYTIPSFITPITIEFTGQTEYIESITIYPERETSDVQITVEELVNIQIEKPIGKDILKYAKITAERLSSVINKAIVMLKVPKSEINNRVDLLYNYGGEWVEAPIKLLREDAKYNYYEATVRSTEYLAITTEKGGKSSSSFTSKLKSLIKDGIQKVKQQFNKLKEKLFVNIFFLILIAIILIIILIKTLISFIKLKMEKY